MYHVDADVDARIRAARAAYRNSHPLNSSEKVNTPHEKIKVDKISVPSQSSTTSSINMPAPTLAKFRYAPGKEDEQASHVRESLGKVFASLTRNSEFLAYAPDFLSGAATISPGSGSDARPAANVRWIEFRYAHALMYNRSPAHMVLRARVDPGLRNPATGQFSPGKTIVGSAMVLQDGTPMIVGDKLQFRVTEIGMKHLRRRVSQELRLQARRFALGDYPLLEHDVSNILLAEGMSCVRVIVFPEDQTTHAPGTGTIERFLRCPTNLAIVCVHAETGQEFPLVFRRGGPVAVLVNEARERGMTESAVQMELIGTTSRDPVTGFLSFYALEGTIESVRAPQSPEIEERPPGFG
jgi:hypothetical protein